MGKIHAVLQKDRTQIVAAMVFSVVAMGINYLISLFLTPYITEHLGTEIYGFVTMAKTFANYGIIITSCLNAFAARYIVVAFHEGDTQRANGYYSSVLLANLLMLLVFAFASLVFIKYLDLFFIIPAEHLAEVQLLFFLDILNYLAVAVANVSVAAAYIRNRLVYVNLIRMAAYGVEAILLILLFRLLPPKVYYVGIALLGSTILLGILNELLKCRLVKELRFRWKSCSLSAIRELVGKGIWNSINQIGNLLNSGLDLWITNRMLTGLAMGQLSIVKTLGAIFAVVPGLLSTPFQPILLKAYAEKENHKLIRTFQLQMKLTGLTATLLLIGFLLLGKSYFQLWTPGEDAQLLYRITMVTLVGFAFEGVVQPLFYTYALTLKNTVPCIVTICSGLLNVLGMYVLLRYTNLELYGVVGTTTMLGMLTFGVFTPLYCAKCLKLSWKSFYPALLRILLSMGAFAGAGLWIGQLAADSWGSLILKALCIVLILVPVYFMLVFNSQEKKQIFQRWRSRS